MQSLKSKCEALAHSHNDFGEHGSSVSIKQPVKSTTNTVVTELIHLLCTDTKQACFEAADELLLAINGFTLNDDRSK